MIIMQQEDCEEEGDQPLTMKKIESSAQED